MTRKLIIGANGQVGVELVKALARRHGASQVIAADVTQPRDDMGCVYEELDVLNATVLRSVVNKHDVSQIFLLASALSARGEGDPQWAWNLNITGLLNVLDAAKDLKCQVFWPSSIAAFGPSTSPPGLAPQSGTMDPATVYGMSKLAGEHWCSWYRRNHAVDIRSIRFPGLISYSCAPGGGTTDYAVEIFYAALQLSSYTCFLDKDVRLPMMYMPDAIRATIELMDAPLSRVSHAGSYNLASMSFTPAELAVAITQVIGSFHVTYSPDYRNSIAMTWPQAVDDRLARNDWGWMPQFALPEMVTDMLAHVALVKSDSVTSSAVSH